MVRRILTTLMLIAILSTSIFTVGVNAEDNLTTKLKENIIPIKTTQAGNGFEDFMALKEILKDKKIIGMGEATHGTKEFFEMKHRMFEFLVEEMGYRVFAIEASFGGCKVVNDYILSIKGTLDEALYAIGSIPWQTQEVADMLQWMRRYNENPMNETKIKFYGFDMQSIMFTFIDIFEDLEKWDYTKYREFEERLSSIDNVALVTPTPSNLLTIKDNILEIKSLYKENKEDYINKTSQSEFDLAIYNLNIVLEWVELNQHISVEDLSKGFNIRDKYMAENIKWILDFETKYYGNDKIMLWAHNLHVRKNNYILEDRNEYITFGNNLNNLFGDEYYSIGFDFYNGSFRAAPSSPIQKFITNDWANFTIDKSSKRTLAYQLKETGIELAYLDFNNAIGDVDLYKLLSSKISMCNIGAIYGGNYLKSYFLTKTVPIETYDALVFVETINASIGINNGITKIQDGDKYIVDFYKPYLLMVGLFMAVILWAIIFIVMKIKNKKIKKHI